MTRRDERTGPGDPVPSPFAGVGARLEAAAGRGYVRVTQRALAPRQSACVRIGVAATWLLFMVVEFPRRHELYGPDAPWSFALAAERQETTGALSLLLWSDSALWFELCYLGGMAATLGMMVGWRTRASAVLFLLTVVSLDHRITVGTAGEAIVRMMAVYLVLVRCGQVWSLDSRRARRTGASGDATGVVLWAVLGGALAAATSSGRLGPLWLLVLWGLWALHVLGWTVRRYASGELRAVCDRSANLAHNAGVLLIMFEICLVYATAGWYKVHGELWQDGTATYYVLLRDRATLPELSGVLAGHGGVVLLMTYLTVFLQVGFVFALLNRRAKNIMLVLLITEHLAIAVLMGLPYFSLVMISADLIFLPTAFLLWAGDRGGRIRRRIMDRLPHRGS